METTEGPSPRGEIGPEAASHTGESPDGSDSGEKESAAQVIALLVELARRRRQLVANTCYAVATALSLLAALAIQYDFAVPSPYLDVLPFYLVMLVAIRMGFVLAFGLMDGRWRYVGVEDAIRLGITSSLSAALFWGVLRVVPALPSLPRAVVTLEWTLFTLGVATVWVAYRRAAEYFLSANGNGEHPERRVVIVGSGDAGNLLAREIRRMPTGHRIVGFLDDDPLKWGTRTQGVPVLGGTDQAPRLLEGLDVHEIIVAIPSARPRDLQRIVRQFESMDVPFKVLPGIREAIEGEVGMQRVRPLRLEDLLGRQPVTLENPELADYVRGRTVMVTGAAGSIGSELCRQIAVHHVGRLILLDQAESSLYFLDLDLEAVQPGLVREPVVADILDLARVREVFDRWKPDAVFHAAAYKHVPLMERNPQEAVRTNVLGTSHVAREAGRCRETTRFVLISTDKAAKPSSVMGASKRAAELLIQELQEEFPDTHFTAVRFGNVLGSDGSVVPLFQRQIAAGGPVTVTHPEATRFFMTIPEAVQLVLRAALVEEARGRIAMLEMGEPMKIVDLARNLIRLDGKRPGAEIQIEFIGLRPGEKLHEDLLGDEEERDPTRLESVYLLRPRGDAIGRTSAREIVDRIAQGSRESQELLGFLGQLVAMHGVEDEVGMAVRVKAS